MNTHKLRPALLLVFSWAFSMVTTTAYSAVAVLLGVMVTSIVAQL